MSIQTRTTMGPRNPAGARAEHEAKAVAQVRQRLVHEFPTLNPEVVEAAVTAAHGSITGPIRDFVPLLVEHNARDRLTTLCRG